jgi:hypothetical protein
VSVETAAASQKSVQPRPTFHAEAGKRDERHRDANNPSQRAVAICCSDVAREAMPANRPA